MIDPATLHRLGTFGKPVGYKGDLCLHTDYDIEPGSFIFLMMDGLPVPYRVTAVRPKGEDLVLSLKGIDDNLAAAKFNGKQVFSEEAPGDENSEGIVYLADLAGYRLFNGDSELGEIVFVDDSTENVLLFVKPAGADNEIIIPAAEEFMAGVDPENKILTMELPEELINLNN